MLKNQPTKRPNGSGITRSSGLVYIQLCNHLNSFVRLSKGSKVHEQQSIVKTVYAKLSDCWTVYVQLSNDLAVYVQLSDGWTVHVPLSDGWTVYVQLSDAWTLNS